MDDELIAYLDAKFAEIRAHVSEECEKVETRLLDEFRALSRTADLRAHQALVERETLGERMLALERRITALERKATS